MTRDELQHIDDVNWKLASSIIESGESHASIVMCLPDGPCVDVSGFLTDGATKHVLGAVVRELAKKYELVIFACEAWVLEIGNDEKGRKADLVAAGVTPSQHPDRIEAVMFNYTVRGLGQAITHHRIIREGGNARLERGELMFPDKVEGRFAA